MKKSERSSTIIPEQDKKLSFSKDFFKTLKKHVAFECEIPIFFSKTNAEKNVYQAEFLAVLETAKDLFCLQFLPEHYGCFEQGTTLIRTHFKYIKNFYFGDIMNIKLQVKAWDQDGYIIESRYSSSEGLHTIGRQWIKFDPLTPSVFSPYQTPPNDYIFDLTITAPHLDSQGCLGIDKVAELFGDTRESMAIMLLPGFKDSIRKNAYGVVTRNANYEFFSPVLRGEKLIIHMRVLRIGITKSSFVLQADYVTAGTEKNYLRIRGEQEIVYINRHGQRAEIPNNLMNVLELAISLNFQN